MGLKAVNWSELTELPPLTNILFTGDEAPFSATLLPNTTTPRKIRVNCQLCTGLKLYISIRDQYNYTQTSNYWQHLQLKHKSTYKQLRSITALSNEEASSQASSSKTSTYFYRHPSAIAINSPNIKRAIIQFIIANNLSFKSAISPEFRSLLTAIKPDIIPPSERAIINEIDDYYNELFENLNLKL
jgi:hypothetical protein